MLFLALVLLSFSFSKADHEIDILDLACGSAFFNLTQKIINQSQAFTPEDTAILLFSGKRPFDLGSKEMCDLTPGMSYKVAIPLLLPSTYIGVCVYDFCRAEFLNQAEEQLMPYLEQVAPQLAQFQLLFYDEEATQDMRDRQHTGFTLVTHLLYLLIAICLIGVAVEYSKCLDRPLE